MAVVTALLELSSGSVHVALFAGHLFLVIPGLVVTGWAARSPFVLAMALPFAVLATAAYEIGWRLTRVGGWFANPLRTAEIIVGALWGAVFVALGA